MGAANIGAGGSKSEVCTAGGNVWSQGHNEDKPGCGTCFCCSPPQPTLAAQGEPQPGYYKTENDVSFCIVTEVLAARLTRWQLVLEDFYRSPATSSIWLARGAPKRWFQFGQGFSVQKAPTRFGRLSFTVSSDKSSLTYRITAPQAAPPKLQWK